MSAINRIRAIFGLDGVDEPNGLDQLRDLLAKREAELTLEAKYGRPYPNMTDEPTVVFPYTLYTSAGEEYGAGAKEFIIPDNGLNDTDTALVTFISELHGALPDDVTFDDVAQVEGAYANAELKENGDVEVGV